MSIATEMKIWEFHCRQKSSQKRSRLWGGDDESNIGLTKGQGHGRPEADTSADKEENRNQDLNWRKIA